MGSVRQRGKRYTALYRDAEGKQRSAGTYDTRGEAVKAWKRAEGGLPPPLAKPVKVYPITAQKRQTVADFSDGWLANHRLEPTTRELYALILRTRILPRFGMKAMTSVTPAEVRAFFRELEAKKVGAATLDKIRVVGSAMYATAINDDQEGIFPGNPFYGIKTPPAPRKHLNIMTRDEYALLLKVIPDRWKLLIRVLAETGIRWGEATGLKKYDLDSSGFLHICRVKQEINTGENRFPVKPYTKNGDIRMIRVSDSLARAIREAPDGEFLFSAARGGNIAAGYFRKTVWQPAIEAAGLRYFRIHDLRHTHASWLLHGGADLAVVRDRLGHHTIATTQRYLHAMDEEGDQALAALENILGAA